VRGGDDGVAQEGLLTKHKALEFKPQYHQKQNIKNVREDEEERAQKDTFLFTFC
jgi:hypothetical protein